MSESNRTEGNADSEERTPEKSMSKAGGYFFAAFETFSYNPPNVVLGQYTADSCVAACCRMMLLDHGIEISEAYLRNELEMNEGAFVSQVPDVLKSFGLNDHYVYRQDLTIDELLNSVELGPAIAFVKGSNALDGHALLVDEIANDLVAVRDPLPESEGKAYRVRLTDFLSVWTRSQNSRGQAAIMVE